jgi:hypothetical protein
MGRCGVKQEAKMAKYIKAPLAVLGLGLLSVAAFLGLVATDAVTSMESLRRTLSCRYITSIWANLAKL